jgi:hypothetical protein
MRQPLLKPHWLSTKRVSLKVVPLASRRELAELCSPTRKIHGEKPMDAIPADYVTLPEAVTARANITSDYELEREFGDYTSLGMPWSDFSAKAYLCCEFSVRELHRGLSDGSIEPYIKDPRSGELMRIPQTAWRNYPLWYETIRGGSIHASACDGMEEFDGQSVFLKRSVVEKHITGAMRRKPASLKVACQVWLKGLLRATPGVRPKPKRQLRDEAKVRFRVSWREFDECWKIANQAVPEATWLRPGAPKKS